MAGWQDPMCIICRYYLHLSAVVCSCRPSKAVCLQVGSMLCCWRGVGVVAWICCRRWELAEVVALVWLVAGSGRCVSGL